MNSRLRQLLADLRRKQATWTEKATELIDHPQFDEWWAPQGKADAYQDAADQLEAILCATPEVAADKFYR